MSNATENHRQSCTERTWCDSPNTHAGEHSGEADLPRVPATGDRDFFRFGDGTGGTGVTVPEVYTRLVEQTRPSARFLPLTVIVSVIVDDDEHAMVHLSLDEADLLRRHLNQLLRYADSKWAS